MTFSPISTGLIYFQLEVKSKISQKILNFRDPLCLLHFRIRSLLRLFYIKVY